MKVAVLSALVAVALAMPTDYKEPSKEEMEAMDKIFREKCREQRMGAAKCVYDHKDAIVEFASTIEPGPTEDCKNHLMESLKTGKEMMDKLSQATDQEKIAAFEELATKGRQGFDKCNSEQDAIFAGTVFGKMREFCTDQMWAVKTCEMGLAKPQSAGAGLSF